MLRRSARVKSTPKKNLFLQTIEVVDNEKDQICEPLVTRIKKTSRNPKKVISPILFGKDKQRASCNTEEEIEMVKNTPKRKRKKATVTVNIDDALVMIHEDKNEETDETDSDDDDDTPLSMLMTTSLLNRDERNIGIKEYDADNADFNVVVTCESPVKHISAQKSPEEKIHSSERNEKDKSCGNQSIMNDTVNNEISTECNQADLVSAQDINQVEVSMKKDEHITVNNDDVDVELSSENVIDKPREENSYKPLKIGLDWSNYEKLGFNKFACNPLMQTLLELKKSFPFKEHVRVNCSREKSNINNLEFDILSLDSIALADKTPANKNVSQLSSQVQATIENELYFDMSATTSRNIDMDKHVENLMKKSVLQDDLEKMEKAPKLFVSKNLIKAQSKKEQSETAGKGWYNLPKTVMTEEIKKDLQLIKMRNVLDPKHHYKRNDSNKLPEYFQIGKVVEGAHEFYSSRVPQSKRKRTMVDELLDDAEFRRKNKKKYIEIRKKQMSGGKGFYKKLKNKRKETWERT